MMGEEFGDRYAESQLARSENPLRKRIKRFYLDRMLRYVRGPTLDVGCGAGQLLELLPPGSAGLEVNPVLVKQLAARGLYVSQVAGASDRIDLGDAPTGAFRTLVLSHVLEHFDQAGAVLRRLLKECALRGFERVIIVVPGQVGYNSDSTHKTFVTVDYLEREGLLSESGFQVSHRSWFPGNVAYLGKLFIYHELMLVYDRTDDASNAIRPPTRSKAVDVAQFARFVMVGVVNTGFAYAVYAALLYAGLGYAVANLIALIVGILFSFKTQGLLVFGSAGNRGLIRFVIVWAAIYFLNIFIIGRFIALGLNPYVAGALALPFATLFSYISQKFFVFRPSPAQRSR
jgi:putative flippase GtrA/SAM-dependent methyltransferase